MNRGKVYLVGTGPGDPKLLTLRAWELIRAAEVAIYDRLVSNEILRLLPESAKRVYVGKMAHHEDIRQDEINELLAFEARRGKNVLRLKGGDPFLFGRGGEEAEALRFNGIDFEVVPGVSSALAVPAYAGLPLTHRRLSSSVAIVTGHEDSSKNEKSVKWSKLAKAVDTIVVLMGAATLHAIAKGLLDGGLDPTTPVAAVQWGTTPNQKTFLFTLEDAKSKRSPLIDPPCVIVVGKVGTLAKQLRWFQEYRGADPVPTAVMGLPNLATQK